MPSSVSQPHVLYVAWGFPPARSGGVYRALATANGFARNGFRVTVLTAEREVFERNTGTDPSMEELVDPGIEVVRLPFEWPYAVTDRRQWSRLRRLFPRVWWRTRVLLDQLPFPEKVYGPWRRHLERAASEIHAKDPVDLVVATANPNVDFTVASHLSSTAGVPYVLDYRDAWLLHVFDGHQIHSDRSRIARVERALVQHATEVWFVNEPIRAWHARRYPFAADRMHVVANGFDPGFAPASRVHARGGGPSVVGPLRFGYIGTVSSKVPMQPLAAGWSRAVHRSPELAGATAEIWGYLGFTSKPDAALSGLIDAHAADGISYAGPLPKARVREVYERFDALLLILGSGRYVTSGKVFEYLASALPIVSVHSPENAASSVLEGYPLWFPVKDLEPDSIAAALTDAAEAARSADESVRAACRDFARPFARDLQLDPRIVTLRTLVSRSS